MFRLCAIRLGRVLLLVALLCLSRAGLAAESADPRLLQQVQAADLMSQLLTWTGDRANARVESMREYLEDHRLATGYDQNPPATPKVARLPYSQIFAQVTHFVAIGGGAKYSDPGLARLTDAQLRRELDALQGYNMDLFMLLNRQWDQAESMRLYLEQCHELKGYLGWSESRLPSSLLMRPATQPADLALRLETIADQIREAEWKRSQAQGMTRQAFEAAWTRRTTEFRRRVAERVKANYELARSFRQPGRSPIEPDEPSAAPAAAVVQPDNSPLMSPDDPRWSSQFYHSPVVGDLPPNWGEWGDGYRYAPAGGVYRTYDQRLNQAWDLRVGNEQDRRLNSEYDRRQNVRIDILEH